MRHVDIKVFLVAKTGVEKDGVRSWLDHVGAPDYEPPYEELTDAEVAVGLPAKRCYMSFEPGLNPNVTKVRSDWTKYIDNILKSGHGSVLEHASWSFAIEGVSRVFTAEMNRHRAGAAISEGSLRYIRFDDVPWWVPPSLDIQDDDPPDVALKKARTLEIFNRAFTQDEENYKELCELWGITDEKSFASKKVLTSMFRRIIGMGVATGGVWTLNCRALRHVLAMRASPHAEEEICYVASTIATMMFENEPRLFGDFHKDDQGFWRPGYVKV